KKLPDVLRVLDAALAAVRRQNLAAPRTASAGRRIQRAALTLSVFNSKGGARNVNLTYPGSNDYYDDQTVSFLYAAYDIFKQADLLSDLFEHLKKQAEAVPGPEKLYAHLALGYAYWWSDEKDEALSRLSEAVRAAPTDHNLLLEVAGMREQNNEHAAAL